jgi:hypothetical protein
MEITTAGRYLYDRAQSLLQEARLTSQKMRKADYKLLRHVKNPARHRGGARRDRGRR